MLEAFALRPEPDEAGTAPLGPVSSYIRIENLHYAYPGRPPALAGVELELQAEEAVALTGENGSGRSTLIYLLMRFANPDQGRMRIDGIDTRQVSLVSLRRQIGLVAQQVLLLNDSVRENIAYGWPEADHDEIEAAARAAQAHKFIQRLPQGYDTRIGDQGIRLSGGQRQRISLARALLKAPPILVLDEATAIQKDRPSSRSHAPRRVGSAVRTAGVLRPFALRLFMDSRQVGYFAQIRLLNKPEGRRITCCCC